MADQIDYDLNLNTAGFVAGSTAALSQVDRLQARMSELPKSAGLVQRTFDAITPKRATLLGFGAATAAAAAQEQALSGLAATQAVLGKSNRETVRSMNELARSYPIGNQGAQQIITTLSRAGIVGDDSRKKIAGLGKVFAELGASGGDSSQLGMGVVQLARAMGDQRLDPTRIRKLSDAVVGVSAHTGSSVQGVLEFSKAIAPLARNAGIGETGVLGISAAFSKIGEDGLPAATAVNKMMSDLNHSVRDGTSELDTYASVVGKTREQFLALYKASPVEALTQVTEAVAKEGPQGQRVLERLGIDSVRGQRALQALSASGGLRDAVQSAGEEYGQGATATGARAAYGGLSDSFTKVETASEQLAVALGAPLLRPLSNFVELLSKPVAAAAKVATSGKVGTGVELLMAGGLALAVSKALGALGMTGSIGRLAYNNQIAGAWRGGRAMGAAGGNETEALRRARLGASGEQMIRRGAYVAPGSMPSRYAQFSEQVYRYREGVGERQAAAAEAARPRNLARYGTETPSAFTKARYGLGSAGNLVAQGFSYSARLSNQMLDVSRMAVGSDERARAVRGRMDPGSPQDRLGLKLRDALRSSGENDDRTYRQRLREATSSVRDFNNETRRGAGIMSSSWTALKASASSSGAKAMATGSLAWSGVKAGAGGLASMLGPTAAIAGVGYYVSSVMSAKRDDKEEVDRRKGLSLTSTLDDYRASMGRAAEATVTLADRVEQAGKAILSTVSDLPRAKEVTEQDLNYAHETRKNRVRDYGSNSSVGEVASRVNMLGLQDPQDVQGVKVDLLRQYNQPFVEQVMKAVKDPAERNTGPGAGATELSPTETGTLFKSIQRNFRDEHNMFARTWNDARGSTDIGQKGQSALDDVVNKLGTIYDQDAKYGDNYARGQQYQNAQAIFAAAVGTKDDAIIGRTMDDLSVALTGQKINTKEGKVVIDDMSRGGAHSLVDYFGEASPEFKKQYDLDQANGTMASTPKRLESMQSMLIGSAPNGTDFQNVLGQYFSTLSPNADRDVNQAVAAVTTGNRTGDAVAQTAATQAIIEASDKAGISLQTLADSAQSGAVALEQTAPERAVLQRVRAEAQRRIELDSTGETSTQRLARQMRDTNRTADMIVHNPEDQAAVDQAKQEQVAQQRQVEDTMKARLQAIYEGQKAEGRARYDFDLGQRNARFDFGLQMTRQEQSYSRQLFRINRDRDIQVGRSREDFERQTLYSQTDFLTQRFRAQRDFNKQMARAAEDGAKAMYDPYKRIQVQAIWDGQSLLANLREQTESMAKQTANLAKIRQSGLSDQAIDVLGLNKADNAQQLQTLLDNSGQDSGLIAQLNQQVVDRQNAGSTLATDAADPSRRRAQEDFEQQLKDQESDFALSTGRSREEFGRSLGRAEDDFQRSLGDMAQDQQIAVAQANDDFDRQMARSAAAFATSMSRMRQDISDSQRELSLGFQDLQKATSDAMNGASVDWQKITTDQLTGTLGTLVGLVPNFADAGKKLAAAMTGDGSSQVAQTAKASGTSGGHHILTGGPTDAEAPGHEGHGHGGGYGYRTDPFTGRRSFHTGVDLPAAQGARVPAQRSGIVIEASGRGSYGNRVTVDHGDGTQSRYAHLAGFDARPGEHVDAGQSVGRAGSTGRSKGPHVHYELLRGGKAVDPRMAGGAALGGPAEHGPTTLMDLGLATPASWQQIVEFVQGYMAGGGGALEARDWGNPDQAGWAAQNIVAAAGGGKTIGGGINKAVKDNFVGFLNALVGSGYHAVSVGGYNNRNIKGTNRKSNHAYGAAIDIDPFELGNGFDSGHTSKIGSGFKGDAFMASLAHSYGLGWGGEWKSKRDWMHFEAANGPSSAKYTGLTVGDSHGGGTPVTGGGIRALGQQIAASMGFGGQFGAIDYIFSRESGWNPNAQNAHSTAYGIPQFLDATWKQYGGKTTDAAEQIKDGIRYMVDRYGSPAGAQAFWQGHHWYGDGGVFDKGPQVIGVGERGPEAVIPLNQVGVDALAQAFQKYMTMDQANALTTKAAATYVTYTGSTTIDQGFHAEGPITVQAEDPDAMARKLQERQRRSNLVQTGGRRGR